MEYHLLCQLVKVLQLLGLVEVVRFSMMKMFIFLDYFTCKVVPGKFSCCLRYAGKMDYSMDSVVLFIMILQMIFSWVINSGTPLPNPRIKVFHCCNAEC